jgi:hypothetical protein
MNTNLLGIVKQITAVAAKTFSTFSTSRLSLFLSLRVPDHEV